MNEGLYIINVIYLEQHFLFDSHVELNFPKASLPAAASVPLVERSISNMESPRSKRDSSSGLWSSFFKKTEHLLSKATGVSPSLLSRSASLERSLARKSHTQGSYLSNTEDSLMWRPLGFSFMPSLSLSKDLGSDNNNAGTRNSLSAAVKRINKYHDLLSTSPDIVFPPPPILVALAEKERREPSRRLTGDEKAALTSILGWEGRDSGARGMTGVTGFVRHQGFSVLYSEHICDPIKSSAPPSNSSTPAPPAQPSTLLSTTRALCCGSRRKWVTYRFYGRGKNHEVDESLGEFVSRVCADAPEPCSKTGCQTLRLHHDMRWIHAGTRIVATIMASNETPRSEVTSSGTNEDLIYMWESCAVCGKESKRREMLDGT